MHTDGHRWEREGRKGVSRDSCKTPGEYVQEVFRIQVSEFRMRSRGRKKRFLWLFMLNSGYWNTALAKRSFAKASVIMGMYRLRNHFEMERRVRNSSTVVFRMPSRPSAKLLASFCTLGSLADLREEEVDAAFDWSRSFLVDPDARLVANAGQAWLLHKMGRDDKARRLFAENRASKDWGHPFYQFQETMLREWGYGGLLG